MIIDGMNRLEILGLNIVAARMMENHWTSKVLVDILSARGAIVSADFLASTQGHSLAVRKRNPHGIKVAICHLRKELSDIGFENIIKTVHMRGYKINPEDNDRIVGALMEYSERV